MCQSQPLRRPLIGLALVFMAGTWGAVMIGGLPPAWPGAACAGLLVLSAAPQAAALFFQRRRSSVSVFNPARPWLPGLLSRLAALGLYLAAGAAAWFAASLRLEDPAPNALSALLEKSRESVEVEGVVADDPVVRTAADGARESCYFPLRLESIRRLIPWQTARGTLQVVWPLAPEGRRPQYGERWRLAGVLMDNARFPEEEFAANSSRPILDWLNRRYTFRVDPDAAIFFGAYQGAPVMEACFKFRRRCADSLALGIGHRPEVVGLLQALLMGYRQELPEKLRNDFIATGTYHIFAISGQHVAILALFMVVILQAYRVSRVKWFLYVMPILAGFTLATGLSSSAVRGCLMALLCFLGPLAGRKPDIPSAMALAALIILVVDPFRLFDYGFLLSFVAVIGLIVLCPPMLRRLAPVMEPDPLRLQPEPRLVQWCRSAIRAVAFLFVASLAACLATTPLVARWFNLVSPIALLANLIVIPVTTLILLAGCLSIILGLIAPVLSEIFNFANVALVSFLLRATDLMAQVPYGHAFVRAPPLWGLAVWYAVLAAWVGWRWKWWIWLVAPIILLLTLGTGWLATWNAVELDLLNTGEHTACLVNSSGGDTWLIDPGSRYHVRKVIANLRRQGVNRLKMVVLTGSDSARVGGTPELLRTLPVRELRFPPGGENSRSLRATLDLARSRGVILRAWSNNVPFAAEETRLRMNPVWRGLCGSTAERGPSVNSRSEAGRVVTTPASFCIFQSEKKDSSAWLWRRGAVSVLDLDVNSVRLAAMIREQIPDLNPTLLVENRMALGREPEDESPAAADFQAAWRIVCAQTLPSGDEDHGLSNGPSLRLPPGQGLCMRVHENQVRWERFVP